MDGLAGEAGSALCRSAPTTNGDSWVAGIFADYDFSSIKGTIGELSGTGLVPFKQSSAWSAGGRIGYLVVPQLLTYFSGGYTNARFDAGEETPTGRILGRNVARSGLQRIFPGQRHGIYDFPRLVREDRVPLCELQFQNNRRCHWSRRRLRF